jgi:transcription initiation factor TFIIA small subunit
METVLQAGKLNTYRFCDNVWTFMLNDVEFREAQEMAKVDKVKIVACDGKSGFAALQIILSLQLQLQ